MKNAHLISVICITICLTASPLFAKDKPGKTGSHGKQESKTSPIAVAGDSGQAECAPWHSGKEPWVAVDVRISDDERRVISGYVHDYPSPKQRGKKPKQLPPGLAKKVARGEQLPPGWQKKCVVGQVMPTEVYEKCHPIPPELVVKLPPPPPDTVTITIGGKVVRLMKATLEILDVFDVHVGR